MSKAEQQNQKQHEEEQEEHKNKKVPCACCEKQDAIDLDDPETFYRVESHLPPHATCHLVCKSCDEEITTKQQRHEGLPMHEFDATCPGNKKEGGCCKSFYFYNKYVDQLPDGERAKFLSSEDEPLSNQFELVMWLPLDFAECKQADQDHVSCMTPRKWWAQEHFMQAAKYTDYALQEEIRNARPWMEAHAISWRKRNLEFIRKDWFSIHRPKFLKFMLREKFTGKLGGDENYTAGDKKVREKAVDRLLSTEGKYIMNCDTDFFWGCNNFLNVWCGKNAKGIALMKLRDELLKERKEQQEKN